MQATLTPRPQIISVWRSVLICAALPAAVACSLFLKPGTLLWGVCSGLWILPFLFFYIVYFPLRRRRLSLEVEKGQLVMRTGVFYSIVRTVPYESIQFVGLRTSPLHKRWQLASLVVVAPGGRLLMPGLDAQEAQRLVRVLLSVREGEL